MEPVYDNYGAKSLKPGDNLGFSRLAEEEEEDKLNKTVILKPCDPIIIRDFSWQDWWELKIKTNFAFFKAIE